MPLINKTLPHRLGPAKTCPTAVHMELFSTSAFKALTWTFANATATTRSAPELGCSGLPLTDRQVALCPPTRLVSPFKINTRQQLDIQASCLSAIHFQGRFELLLLGLITTEWTNTLFYGVWHEHALGTLPVSACPQMAPHGRVLYWIRDPTTTRQQTHLMIPLHLKRGFGRCNREQNSPLQD